LIVVGFWEIPAGMKVYETNENEMILEPSLKFAGNPNIIVAVKAFGVKATVQVTCTKHTTQIFNNGFSKSFQSY
jgi:hypothetical protein